MWLVALLGHGEELTLLFLFMKGRELCRLIDFYSGSSEGILLLLCGFRTCWIWHCMPRRQ
jgi:hypothetical protein